MSRAALPRVLILPAVALSLAVLASCSHSPATRFYALTPTAGSADRRAPTASAPAVGIRSVELPATLDRPQIVTRTGANTLEVAEFDRWSAPLRDSIAHLLAENLSVLIPTERIAVYPWPPGISVDHQVMVEIAHFEGQLGGACALDAQWRVVSAGVNSSPIFGRSSLSEAAGATYASLVAAQSRLVGALSSEIAAAIRTGIAQKAADVNGGNGR